MATSQLPLSEIITILTPLEDKYFQLGIQLGIEAEAIKAIEGNYPMQSRRFSETIILWQNKSTRGQRWSTLADAVQRVGGYDRLVEELRAQHTNSEAAQNGLSANAGPSLSANATPSLRVHLNDTPASQNTARPSHSLTSSDSTGSTKDESGYLSRNGSASSDSLELEEEPFEYVPGCGCPQDNPCSLYTLCTTGCPNQTSRRVPGMLWRKSQSTMQCQFPMEDEPDFEDYEKRTKAIRKSYANFVVETCDSFEKNEVSIHKLTLYLQSVSEPMKARADELNAATRMETVFKIVIQACSWFDYELVKDIAKHFGDSSAKDYVVQYEKCFKEYAEQRLPEGMKHIEIDIGTMKGAKKVVIKVDKEWKDIISFNRIDEIRGHFASILGVRRRELFLASVRNGCIMMTFLVPEGLLRNMVQTKNCFSTSQLNAFKEAGIILIKYGKMTWRPGSKAEAEELSSHGNSEVFNAHNERQRSSDLCILLTLAITALAFLTLHSACFRVNSDGRSVFPVISKQLITSLKYEQLSEHFNFISSHESALTHKWSEQLATVNLTQLLLKGVQLGKPVYYVVETNVTDSKMHLRNAITSSLQFYDVFRECVVLELFVSATNDSPIGLLARIVDVVHISTDVTNISQSLAVNSVDVRNGQGLAFVVSFKTLQSCSDNFPILNYTLRVDNISTEYTIPNSSLPQPGLPFSMKINDSMFPELVLDTVYSIRVNACSEFSCKMSNPQTLYTSDLQSVNVVVLFERNIFISCTFANNSLAAGCSVRLPLLGSNDTTSGDVFELRRPCPFGPDDVVITQCNVSTNQRKAYDDIVGVAVREDGTLGEVVLVAMETEADDVRSYTRDTGCTLPQEALSLALSPASVAIITVSVIIIETLMIIVIIPLYILKKTNLKKLQKDAVSEPPSRNLMVALNVIKSNIIEKEPEKEQSPFLFKAWLTLTLLHWICDFGRGIYAFHVSETFPMSLPSIGDYGHMIYNVMTGFCILYLLRHCVNPVPTYIREFVVIIFVMGTSIHLVGDSVQHRLILLGYKTTSRSERIH